MRIIHQFNQEGLGMKRAGKECNCGDIFGFCNSCGKSLIQPMEF